MVGDDYTDDMHFRINSPTEYESPFIFRGEKNDPLFVERANVMNEQDASTNNKNESSLLTEEWMKQHHAFHVGEEATILKVLDEIDRIERRQHKQGFKEVNFTCGVMNCLLVAYVWGAFPGHFWLVYLVESLYFIPSKFYYMVTAKPLNQALYYFDFCWMMNFTGVVILIIFGTPTYISDEVRKQVFLGCFGIASGPLLGATALLPFVAFIFHDVNTMTNLVIHALPPMLMYTMRWHADDLREAWPNTFELNYFEDIKFFPGQPFGFGSIAGNAILIYLLWFVPYTIWMLLIGLDLPRKNRRSKQRDGKTPKPPTFDTVFHSFWRAGHCKTIGSFVWKRPILVSQTQMEMDDFETRDFLVYMFTHAVLCLSSIFILAFACNFSKLLNGLILLAVILICVHRGSIRYTYYTTSMYSKIVRTEFVSNRSEGQHQIWL